MKDLESRRAEIEAQIVGARAELKAYREMLALFPGDGAPKRQKHFRSLKSGGDMDRVHQFLLRVARPAHLHEIIKGIGREVNDTSINSIGSQVSTYARQGRFFRKTGTMTFAADETNYVHGGTTKSI